MRVGDAFLEFNGANKYIYVKNAYFYIKNSYEHLLKNNKLKF